MNKDELTASKQAKKDEFEAIVKVAEDGKRELTDVENTAIGNLKTEVRDLETKLNDIEVAEVAEREAKELKAKEEAVAESKRKDDELESAKRELAVANEKLNKRSNKMTENKTLFELFRERLDTGNSTSITLSERADADGDTTAMAAAVPLYVKELDIIGKAPLWRQIGADILTGAQGTYTLPHESPIIGAKLAELAAATGDTVTPTGILVTPNRFVVQKTFTLETLNSATPEFISSVTADMVRGCDRAITTELYTKALAAATEVAAGDVTKAGFDALMGAVDIENDGVFLADRGSFFECKGVAIDTGSGRFLVERVGDQGKGMTYDGTPFWYSNLFIDGVDQQYVQYLDPSKIHIADYGQVEIILDKFTLAGEGQVIMTVVKLANVSVKNPDAFAKSVDLDAA